LTGSEVFSVLNWCFYSREESVDGGGFPQEKVMFLNQIYMQFKKNGFNHYNDHNRAHKLEHLLSSFTFSIIHLGCCTFKRER